MFGFRPDGRRVRKMDPMVQLTPYLMPQRCDAQVFLQQKLDYETLARYIANQTNKGNKITFMEIMIAAYIRGISQVPEANRFIVNKQVFSRNELTVSFTMLRNTSDGSIEETAVKIKFDPTDTIFDVANRVKVVVEENRKEEVANFTLKLVRTLMSVPLLPNVFVAFVMMLDRYGLMPRFLVDAIPFHTGMFITNMASIGMHSVYHHIYNFGTTSMFLSLGTPERTLTMDADGQIKRKRLLPVGITADERVCAGAVYAKLFAVMLNHLNNPELLEKPPETVKYNDRAEYHVAKPTAK
jgi:2-oxoacid dehydrogenases acyltransferase (catalytic domain).